VSTNEPFTLRSDVRDAGRVLEALLPGAQRHIDHVDRVAQRALALDPAERFNDAGEFRTALDQAASEDFGPEWRDRVDLSGLARVPEPVDVPSDEPISVPLVELPDDTKLIVPAPIHPVAHRVKVRSPKRPQRPAGGTTDPSTFLEARDIRLTGGDGNAGKLIPIAAAVVVIAAIIVLVFTHHDSKPTSAPALSFRGTYSVTTTLKSAGVGVDQGQPAGTVRTERWVVTPTCPSSGDCTASVAVATGTAFALTYSDGSWGGQRAVTSANGCVSAYTYTLVTAGTGSTAAELSGTAVAIAAGCGPPGPETQSLLLTRR
jgi:hypothetical protein